LFPCIYKDLRAGETTEAPEMGKRDFIRKEKGTNKLELEFAPLTLLTNTRNAE
jgi:hypothetical protein